MRRSVALGVTAVSFSQYIYTGNVQYAARRSTRRHFLRGSVGLAGSGLLTGCGVSLAPGAKRFEPHRIGFLNAGTPDSTASNLDAFRQGLRDLGREEGRDISFEVRLADGREERLPDLATELVRLRVALIVTGGREAISAARQATSTIPIVFATAGDPVAEGAVASLARPGGNATGLSLRAGEEWAKRLQRLKEVAPSLSRVAVLWNPRTTLDFAETEAAAGTLGLAVQSFPVSGPDDFEAVTAGSAGRADGLIVLTDAVFQALAPRIVALAATNGWPAIYGTNTYMRAGGLMYFGASIPGNYRRAAVYVDRILAGARPADLPVEQPSTFDFVINLTTARTLGLTIPPTVLAQATEIIQ